MRFLYFVVPIVSIRYFFFVLLFLRQQWSTYENVRFEEYLDSFHKKTVSRLHFHWFLRLFRGAPRYV